MRSSRVSVSLGEQKRADPPPLMQATISVLESEDDASSRISVAAATDRASGTGWDADRTRMLYFSFSVLISSSVAWSSFIITTPSNLGAGIFDRDVESDNTSAAANAIAALAFPKDTILTLS
jgi:hypothetical protein